jgi:NAD-dependent DNA ligase
MYFSTKTIKNISNNNNNIQKTKKSNNISDKEIAKNELIELNKEINFHDDMYYNQNEQVISDAEYDKLIQKVNKIEEKYSELQGIVEKTTTVGAKITSKKFVQKQHSTPMLSLDNAFNENDLTNFLNRTKKSIINTTLPDGIEDEGETFNIKHNSGKTKKTTAIIEYILEPKIDGLSLSIVYKNGKLFYASTRGDGFVGEDVTFNIKKIKNIPLQLPLDHPVLSNLILLSQNNTKNNNKKTDIFIEIRGEVYISKEDFKKLNKLRINANETAFSTSRNAASGSLRVFSNHVNDNLTIDSIKNNNSNNSNSSILKTTTSTVLDRFLRFFAYSFQVSDKNLNTDSYSEIFNNASINNKNNDAIDDNNNKNLKIKKKIVLSKKNYKITEIKTQKDILNFVKEVGFDVAQPTIVCKENNNNNNIENKNEDNDDNIKNEIVKNCQDMELKKNDWDFDADGVVVKVNNLKYQELLGS